MNLGFIRIFLFVLCVFTTLFACESSNKKNVIHKTKTSIFRKKKPLNLEQLSRPMAPKLNLTMKNSGSKSADLMMEWNAIPKENVIYKVYRKTGGIHAEGGFEEQKDIVVKNEKNDTFSYSDTIIKKDIIERVSEWEPLRIYAYQVIASNDSENWESEIVEGYVIPRTDNEALMDFIKTLEKMHNETEVFQIIREDYSSLNPIQFDENNPGQCTRTFGMPTHRYGTSYDYECPEYRAYETFSIKGEFVSKDTKIGFRDTYFMQGVFNVKGIYPLEVRFQLQVYQSQKPSIKEGYIAVYYQGKYPTTYVTHRSDMFDTVFFRKP